MTVPRLIFLCSGHMIDQLGRQARRFPPECEPRVAAEIDATLAALGAGHGDLAITQGACGADLLFAEAMLKRGAALQLQLPVHEEAFITKSVDFRKAPSTAPDRWRHRFLAAKAHPLTQVDVMPADQSAKDSESAFERCNLWMLERALAFGAHKVRFICVWNGAGGDGPGGTDHMRKAVRQRGGAECWIDTRKLCER